MKRTRTYYCNQCQKATDFVLPTTEMIECECGYTFGRKFDNTRNHVNMRKTWAKTSKVEFNQTTMADDIKSRGGTW